MLRPIALSFLILSLAACSTGTPAADADPTTPIDTPPDPDAPDAGPTGADDNSPPDTAFDVYADAATILYNEMGGVYDPIRTRSANLPDTGTVAYDGVLGVTLPRDGDSVLTLGELNLTVAFDGSAGNGSVTEMIDEIDTTYVGTLAIADVRVNTAILSDPQLAGTLSGILVDEGSVSYTVEGTISGDFYEGTDYVTGSVLTDVTVDGATDATESEFIATFLPQ